MVSAEATRVYNCLAWSLGISNAWVWPWLPWDRKVTKAEFDALYKSHGFKPASGSGPIAAFGNALSDMTHGAISGAGHGPRWESKLGEQIRIQHGMSEMEGGSYGKVQGFYDQASAAGLEQPGEGKMKPFSNRRRKRMALSKAQFDYIKQRAARLDDELRTRFDTCYAAWKRDWEHPTIALSSNPAMRTYSTHFLDLVAMGPAILPLLMARLSDDEDDFFALQVVDRLLPAPMIVVYDLEDDAVLAGEQGRAAATVRRWVVAAL